MSAPHLLISEVTPLKGEAEVLASKWASLPKPELVTQREVYIAQDGSTVLEVLALRDLNVVMQLHGHWQDGWDMLGQHLASDFARQTLSFIEAPKDSQQAIPPTPYLQLRHVEVPPPAYEDYRAWRERTIFDVVRGAKEVDFFLAYHSVISTEPGVMFLSGFTCAMEDYSKVFSSARYQQIVREAGTQFITGGDKGLYTKIYRRVSA
jgi:hypothetical protein